MARWDEFFDMKLKAALKSIMQPLQGRKEVEAKQICVNGKKVRGKSGEILSIWPPPSGKLPPVGGGGRTEVGAKNGDRKKGR